MQHTRQELWAMIHERSATIDDHMKTIDILSRANDDCVAEERRLCVKLRAAEERITLLEHGIGAFKRVLGYYIS